MRPPAPSILGFAEVWVLVTSTCKNCLENYFFEIEGKKAENFSSRGLCQWRIWVP